MSGDDGLYITLPSDASMDEFPNNTLTEFTVRLNQPLVFDQAKSVALAEIFIPQTWDSLETETNRVYVELWTSTFIELEIPKGRYDNPHVLIDAINKVLAQDVVQHEETDILFLYEKDTKRVTVHFPQRKKNKVIAIYLDVALSRRLGFLSPPWITRFAIRKTQTAQHPPTFGSTAFIYCYSDLALPSFVGDVSAQLLRIVPVVNSSRDGHYMITQSYVRLFYTPTIRMSVDTITIYLRDSLGRPILFNTAVNERVVVVLHVRNKDSA